MEQQILRETVTADKNHFLHIQLPKYFSNEVEVLILPLKPKVKQTDIPPKSMAMMKITDETAFVQDVINSKEEDCWNDL